jgi:hypothetical protein
VVSVSASQHAPTRPWAISVAENTRAAATHRAGHHAWDRKGQRDRSDAHGSLCAGGTVTASGCVRHTPSRAAALAKVASRYGNGQGQAPPSHGCLSASTTRGAADASTCFAVWCIRATADSAASAVQRIRIGADARTGTAGLATATRRRATATTHPANAGLAVIADVAGLAAVVSIRVQIDAAVGATVIYADSCAYALWSGPTQTLDHSPASAPTTVGSLRVTGKSAAVAILKGGVHSAIRSRRLSIHTAAATATLARAAFRGAIPGGRQGAVGYHARVTQACLADSIDARARTGAIATPTVIGADLGVGAREPRGLRAAKLATATFRVADVTAATAATAATCAPAAAATRHKRENRNHHKPF